MPKTYETLLKKIMEDKQVSGNVLSKITGIPRSTLANYVNGVRKPDVYSALVIVKNLNLKMDILWKLFEPVSV